LCSANTALARRHSQNVADLTDALHAQLGCMCHDLRIDVDPHLPNTFDLTQGRGYFLSHRCMLRLRRKTIDQPDDGETVI